MDFFKYLKVEIDSYFKDLDFDGLSLFLFIDKNNQTGFINYRLTLFEIWRFGHKIIKIELT